MDQRRESGAARRAGSAGRPARPAGVLILIPGLPQWVWRQRERALVLFGSFATALGVGLFMWGTHYSLVILAFAFGTHVISAADVIRQGAFPGFGRWVPMASASAGLGLACYGPAAAVGLAVAWPGYGGPAGSAGYLIDRAAYWRGDPAPGDWAWVRLPGRPGPSVVRVLAVPGQEVEFSASGLRVAGQGVRWSPPPGASPPRELALTVPAGQILVAPEAAASGWADAATGCGMVLLDRRGVGGRAWARLYPLWDRALLP